MLDAPYTIVNVIQLAVAPVFLLTGIAAMLAVLNARLARIVDRLRLLEASREDARSAGTDSDTEAQLSRRARLVYRAVALSTAAALCISAVIAVIFLSFFFGLKTAPVIAALFVAATLAFMLALLNYLREMQLAARIFRPAGERITVTATEVREAA